MLFIPILNTLHGYSISVCYTARHTKAVCTFTCGREEHMNAEKVQFCLQHNSIMLFTKVGQLLTAPALHLDQVSLNTCTLQFEPCGEGALHMNAM